MLENFSFVFIFLVVAVAFIALNLTVSKLLRPHNPYDEKSEIYDCGEVAVGPGYRQFNMRFYLIALVFVIFDVEIAFMYPVTAVFKEMLHGGWGLMAFSEILIFVLILLVGFVYAWSQGGLDWVRDDSGLVQKPISKG